MTDTIKARPGPDEYAPGYEGWRSTALIIFLVLLNILNFIDRQLLQSFVVDVRRDLNLSYFQFTLLTGLFFSISYSVAGVFMGMLADRFARPKLIAGGLFVWSGLTAVCGMATNFAQLATARAFVALGEATLSPSALSMVSDAFPERRHGLMSGIYYLGIPIGAGGSLLVAGILGPLIGWRGCFLLLGVLGIIASVAVLLLRDPPRRSAASDASPPPLSQAINVLMDVTKRSAPLRYLLLGAGLAIFSQGGLVLDQAWLVEERGYEISRAQTIFGILFLVAGVVGTIVGGQLSDMAHARFKGGRMVFMALAFALVTPVGILYRFLPPDTPFFYLAAIIGSIAIMLPYGPIVSSASELAPSHGRAMVIAFTVLVMALFGTAFGNAFAGWLSDAFIRAGFDQPLTWALLVSGAVGLLSIPCFWMASRTYDSGKEAVLQMERAGQ